MTDKKTDMQKQLDVQNKGRVVTVTLTPAVDVSLNVDRLTPGQLHRVAGFRQDPGGKGINVSKALHAFGVPTVATGFLGGQRGAWIRDQLQTYGVASQFVFVDAETRMNVKVTDADGTLTEFNSETTGITESDFAALERILDSLVMSGDWVVFSGKLPPNCPVHWYREAIRRARAQGAKTLLDTSGDALCAGIEANPDVIKPNWKELEQLVARPLATVEEVMTAARQIVEQGVAMVVVSLGAQGLIAVRTDDTWVVRVPKVRVHSTVGAGDTAVAGLLYGYHHGLCHEDMVRFAAAAGTAAVTKVGTAYPTLQDIRAILPQIEIQGLGVTP